MASHENIDENINYRKIVDAYDRIRKILKPTPIHTSSTIDSIFNDGKKIYFKCENFQKTGSFKVRGALNAILIVKQSLESNKNDYVNAKSTIKGCITHSSGNHGAALSWAANYANIPCTVVLPKNTPQVKVESIKAYNSKVEYCENSALARVELCDKLSREQDLLVIKPYDDYNVMCGQGTIALEFLQQVPNLDAIVVSISGGGLISGICICAKSIKPSIRIIGVEPEGKKLVECIKTSNRNPENKSISYLKTIAEGIRTEQCGQLTFPIISRYLSPEDVITISDNEMIEATRFVFKRMKLVIELAAGAAVAAIMKTTFKNNYPNLKNVGVILCGGNIDIDELPWI